MRGIGPDPLVARAAQQPGNDAMANANELCLLAGRIAVPSIVAAATWWARRRGIAVASGWGGVVFVFLCLGVALVSIVYRAAH
jgi:hypothetical protein